MAWKQSPTSPPSQVSDHAYDSGMIPYLLTVDKSVRWQCKGKLQSPEMLYVFLTFILMVAAFSALVHTRIYAIDENYGPRIRPNIVLQFDSFSVIDFRVMDKQLVANWTAKFIFINKENDVEISIEPFELLVFYKGTNLVSCASVGETLVSKTKYESVMEVEFSPKRCNEELSINDEVLHRLEEDLKKGKISLHLNLELEARYKGCMGGYYLIQLKPGCALDMEFNSSKLSAEPFSGALAKDCLIPLLA